MAEELGSPAAKKTSRPLRAALITLALLVGAFVLIGLPSYGDYTHRAQASEAVVLLSAAKAPLAEYFADQKHWPDQLSRVLEVDAGTYKYTQSVAITRGAGGTGEIELTAVMRADRVDRRVAGKSVRLLSTDGGKSWTCRPGTMPEKILPQQCRTPL